MSFIVLLTDCLNSFIFQQYRNGFKVEFSKRQDNDASQAKSKDGVDNPVTANIATAIPNGR